MEQIALLSLVTANIAFIVAESSLFGGFRGWLQGIDNWLSHMVGCGYCLSQWIALALVAVYRPRLYFAWWPLDYCLTALAIGGLASVIWLALCGLSRLANK